MTILNESLLSLRTQLCKKCVHNVGDVCQQCKVIHPDRDCIVSIGIPMCNAHCPIGEWDKACSCVWVYKKKGLDGLFHSVRLAEKNTDANNLVICGDSPAWWAGQTIPSNKSPYSDKWQDSLVKLQRIIDSPLVTDNFLWMYCDTFILAPTTIKYLALPKYGTLPSGGSTTWNASYTRTISLLQEIGASTHNFSTHYPVVYNKHLLQNVLDSFKPTYLIESLYLNIYGKDAVPITDEFQFQRECIQFDVPETTKVLNIKSYTPCAKRIVESR